MILRLVARGTLPGLTLAAFAFACGGAPSSQNSRRGDLQWQLEADGATVRQTDLDFGEVEVGSPARRSFELVNAGTDRALITSVRFEEAASGTFFVQAPDAVPAGEKRPMSVTFAPAEPGTYAARLVLEHDGDTRSASMNLTGTAR